MTDAERVTLKNPADVIAAVPALLGYTPTDSLVLVALGPGDGYLQIKCVARIDVANLTGDDIARPSLNEVVEYLASQGCTDLCMIVVGGGAPLSHPELVQELATHCENAQSITLGDRLWISKIAKGEQWHTYGDPHRVGLLPDPASTVLAATTVMAGQVIHPARCALEQTLAEGDPDTLLRRAQILHVRLLEFLSNPDILPTRVQSVALIEGWLARAAVGVPRMTDNDVVELCLTLGDALVRDICIGICVEDRWAEPGQRLWTALLREAPAPVAAEVALLLACSALRNGDATLANMALQRAQRAWPGHILSAVLLQALQAGMTPMQLTQLCTTGAQQARAKLALDKEGRGE